MWQKLPRKLFQENPQQTPPEFAQQKSQTYFCRLPWSDFVSTVRRSLGIVIKPQAEAKNDLLLSFCFRKSHSGGLRGQILEDLEL